MFAILHALGMFVADLFKSRCRFEAENLLSWRGCTTNMSGYSFGKDRTPSLV
jgi:hypothetical protein